MPFQLSPGVVTNEIDLTTIIPAVSTTTGGLVGDFEWGPANTVVTVDSEITLASVFGKPTNNSAVSFFSAASFLAYGNNLKVVRALNNGSWNATSNGSQIRIENENDWFNDYRTNATTNNLAQNSSIVATGSGPGWVAKYPGPLGNSIKVAFLPARDSAQFSNWAWKSFFDAAPGTSQYAASKGAANDEIHVVVIDNNGAIATGGTPAGANAAGSVLETFKNLSVASDAKNWDGSPNFYVDVIANQSKWVHWISHPANTTNWGTPATNGVSYSGLTGSSNIANVSGFTIVSGGSGYSNGGYLGFSSTNGVSANAQILVNGSGAIVNIVNVTSTGTGYTSAPTITLPAGGAGGEVTVVLFTDLDGARLNVFNGTVLSNGSYNVATNADKIVAWDKMKNADEVDVSLLITGDASSTVAQHVIDNIAEYRKDCVAFFSPAQSDVVGNPGSETTDVIDQKNNTSTGINRSTSYGVYDSGWKYMFDKYNNTYRWIPLNADIAGLCVNTDNTRDPWYSPAGFNRGFLKNVVKLAWNPNKTNRDDLYKSGVNPVVSFTGEGTVLFGDKTMLTKPSAFDRINVRRLFIVLEKAIATAAKYSLFEFNDEFTRAQFVSLVDPFLRDVQGRRGIFDYRVVCDTTNNTPEVIDRNEFIGDIYIKPARSINFIQLNFVAVRSGVAFDEIVGKF